MHFEVLVEDLSGKKTLDILIPKMLGSHDTFMVHSYKGIGHIPQKSQNNREPSKRHLLNQLERLLKGYGKTFAQYPSDYKSVVILVCDLDKRNIDDFLNELNDILHECNPKPETYFCIAIEEGEAWFLGDLLAIKRAYPKAKEAILKNYKNDSIVGTWQVLADAVFPGGSSSLLKKGWQTVGAEKSKWAENITPYMDFNENKSPSFCFFRDIILSLLRNE